MSKLALYSGLYVAYGSNLNKSQMRRRCPDAKPVCGFVMPNHKLVFRGVADVIHEWGAEVHVGLWRITRRCEQSLDVYEGVNPKRPEWGMYRKVYLKLSLGRGKNKRTERALMYVMNDQESLALPSQYYYDAIKQDYRDFRLPVSKLEQALDETMDALCFGESEEIAS